jgi:hypothetical protein
MEGEGLAEEGGGNSARVREEEEADAGVLANLLRN